MFGDLGTPEQWSAMLLGGAMFLARMLLLVWFARFCLRRVRATRRQTWRKAWDGVCWVLTIYGGLACLSGNEAARAFGMIQFFAVPYLNHMRRYDMLAAIGPVSGGSNPSVVETPKS